MGGECGWGSTQEGWRKGPWTAQEDKLLFEHVCLHGEGRWNFVSPLTGLRRSGKSCRLRWVNYLRPDLKRGRITPHEESIIKELHSRWGNRWSAIARTLPGRTDNEIKNYWRTHFKKAKPPKNRERERGAHLLRQQQRQHHQHEKPQYIEHPGEGSFADVPKVVGYSADTRRADVPQFEEHAASLAQCMQDLSFLYPVPSHVLPTDASLTDEASSDEGSSWSCLWNVDGGGAEVGAATVPPDARGSDTSPLQEYPLMDPFYVLGLIFK